MYAVQLFQNIFALIFVTYMEDYRIVNHQIFRGILKKLVGRRRL